VSADLTGAPPRPSIPPLLWFTAGLWAGVMVAEGVAWEVWCDGALFGRATAWCCLGLLALGTCALATGRTAPGVTILLMGVGLGLCVGAVYWGWWSAQARALSEVRPSRWTVDTLADPRTRRERSRTGECRMARRVCP
jgi:hypothetical protein